MYINQIAQNYFNTNFDGRVIINGNMQTLGGDYNPKTNTISINSALLFPQFEAELEAIIKHELIHFIVCRNGLPNRHNARDFALLVEQSGASVNDYPKCLTSFNLNTEYVFRCPRCKKEYRLSNNFISRSNGELYCTVDNYELEFLRKN